MTSKTYAELLKDPRWQKKRMVILQRDNFMCRYCGDDEKTLNVHHFYYENYPDGSSRPPWDYPNDALITLCESCNLREKTLRKISWERIQFRLGQYRAFSDDYVALADFIDRLGSVDGRSWIYILDVMSADPKYLEHKQALHYSIHGAAKDYFWSKKWAQEKELKKLNTKKKRGPSHKMV